MKGCLLDIALLVVVVVVVVGVNSTWGRLLYFLGRRQQQILDLSQKVLQNVENDNFGSIVESKGICRCRNIRNTRPRV